MTGVQPFLDLGLLKVLRYEALGSGATFVDTNTAWDVYAKRIFPIGPVADKMFVVHYEEDMDMYGYSGKWLLFTYVGDNLQLLDVFDDPGTTDDLGSPGAPFYTGRGLRGYYAANEGFFPDATNWTIPSVSSSFKLNDQYSLVLSNYHHEDLTLGSIHELLITFVSVVNDQLVLERKPLLDFLGTDWNSGYDYAAGGTQFLPERIDDNTFTVFYQTYPDGGPREDFVTDTYSVSGTTVTRVNRDVTLSSTTNAPVQLLFEFANGIDSSQGYKMSNGYHVSSDLQTVTSRWNPADPFANNDNGSWRVKSGDILSVGRDYSTAGYGTKLDPVQPVTFITFDQDPTGNSHGNIEGGLASPGFVGVRDSNYVHYLGKVEDNGTVVTAVQHVSFESLFPISDPSVGSWFANPVVREIVPGINIVVAAGEQYATNNPEVFVALLDATPRTLPPLRLVQRDDVL